MGDSAIQHRGGGWYQGKGALSFATVARIWADSRDGFGADTSVNIDLGEISEVDSAGLALVLEWVRWARGAQRQLTFTHVPAKLMALARMSEVDKLLGSVTRPA